MGSPPPPGLPYFTRWERMAQKEVTPVRPAFTVFNYSVLTCEFRQTCKSNSGRVSGCRGRLTHPARSPDFAHSP
jgi:hypothetical protein